MRVVALSLPMLLACACTTRIGDLTVASPKNLPGEFTEIRRGVEGQDCSYVVLFFIPVGTLNPTIDGAIDDALAKVPDADALVDATLYNDLLLTLIFNSNCIRIEGTAIRTRP